MTWLQTGVTVAAVGSGVMGGVLFAFSSFVMPALNRIPAREAVLAMQSINERAPAGLGLPLVGTALVSGALAVHAIAARDDGWELRLAGSALYLVAFVITVAYHIPRNNSLDALDANSAAVAQSWPPSAAQHSSCPAGNWWTFFAAATSQTWAGPR